MGNSFAFTWEVELIKALQAHFGGIEIFISKLLTLFGQEYPLVLIILILYFCVNKTQGKRICINIMAVLIWAPMIKNVFFRSRPYFDNEEIKILIPPAPTEPAYDLAAQGYSLPSQHTACATAAYPSLGKFTKKKSLFVIAIILVILVGVSRVCVGAHYPTDVICGWALGGIVASLLPVIYSKVKNENIVNFVLLATGIPGLFYCKTEDFFSGFGLFLGCVIGFAFEEKYVNFEMPKNWKEGAIRIILGIGVFLLFAQGIKFIFGQSLLVRVIRYSIGSFITLAIYPMLFKKFKK